MAIPISATPTLRGKEAEEFEKKAEAAKYGRAPVAEVAEAIDTYIKVMRGCR